MKFSMEEEEFKEFVKTAQSEKLERKELFYNEIEKAHEILKTLDETTVLRANSILKFCLKAIQYK